MGNHEIRRGDIFYIDKFGRPQGSEQYAGRPGIIVSNDMNNKYSKTVEVVYCTTKPKEDLPTHVKILSTSAESTVLCEQVTTVSVDKLSSYFGSCTEEEMKKIDEAILVSLWIDPTKKGEPKKDNRTKKESISEPHAKQLLTLKVERDMYKKLYESLLNRIVPISQQIPTE